MSPEPIDLGPQDQLELAPEERQSDAPSPVWVARRDALLKAADSARKLDKIEERVAWLLNHYPETRNSDRPLWFRYWTVFEPDGWDGRAITLEDAFRLTSPTSLTRTRAKIQNTYGLFLADAAVREKRGTLGDAEREKVRAQVPPAPLFSVYADESGKNAAHLIVGSVWFLLAPEIIAMRQAIDRIKTDTSFRGELHFKEIDERNLDFYLDVARVITRVGAAVSFKAVSVERRGIGRQDAAFEDLFYHLLVRGVEHENATGRARLPRRLAMTKDREEIGRDQLMLANLRDRVAQAGEAGFGGELTPTEFISDESDKHQLLQIADLYTGSINRLLNSPGDGAKDRFAQELLQLIGIPAGPQQEEHAGDLGVHIAL